MQTPLTPSNRFGLAPTGQRWPGKARISRENPGTLLLVTGAIGLVQVLLLAWAMWRNQSNLNADGVAYLRLASYYAEGKSQLMISGYWGPLLSWLAAVWIALGIPLLVAGRLAMASSAVVYAWGSRALLRALPLPTWTQHAGFGLAAMFSVYWSVEYISPDLLVSGLVCFATGLMIREDWRGRRAKAVMAGISWGLAYLAKAVALPLAFLMGAAIALLWQTRQGWTISATWRSLRLTWGTCILVAMPWMAVLSLHYGRPTFSTAARIAHAVAGPADVDRYHPYARAFHRPETGRVTAWEDPSVMDYHYWSPLESGEYFGHQLQVVRRNAVTVLALLGGFDLVHIGVAGLVACVLLALREGGIGRRQWLLLPALALCPVILYLPLYVQLVDQRYFYVCYPFLWSGAAMALCWLSKSHFGPSRVLTWVLGSCWVISFVTPAVLGVMFAVSGLSDTASQCAEAVASRIKEAGLTGPVAGSGLISGGRTGLYVAFLIDQPWHGDVLRPAPADYLSSGARLIVVGRRQPIAVELDSHPSFRSLDDLLFRSASEAASFPLKLYEARR